MRLRDLARWLFNISCSQGDVDIDAQERSSLIAIAWVRYGAQTAH